MCFEDLMKDRTFLSKLTAARDMAEVKEMFGAKGVAVTDEQLIGYVLPGEDELSEEALEYVSGGSIVMNPFLFWLHSRSVRKSGGGGHRF